MAITTTTGTVTPTTLLVSSASNVTLTADAYTSLLSSDPVTIAGSGHTVSFIGTTDADDNDFVQVLLVVDEGLPGEMIIVDDASGRQITVRVTLSAGNHTVAFRAYSLGSPHTMRTAGVTALDLGL